MEDDSSTRGVVIKGPWKKVVEQKIDKEIDVREDLKMKILSKLCFFKNLDLLNILKPIFLTADKRNNLLENNLFKL
mgnify:CR=1 FL=1